jgi:hypothetical protein
MTQHPQGWIKKRQIMLSDARRLITGELLLNSSVSNRLNLSQYRHSVIAPVLRSLAYDTELSGSSLPMIFDDGSVPKNFPTGILHPADHPPFVDPYPLKMGLMTGRHPEMCYFCSMFVVRNEDMAGISTMAAEERIAYYRCLSFLEDEDEIPPEGIVVQIFHTGLEPMVTGFYRGVAQVLADRIAKGLPRNLVIQPMLYNGPGIDKVELPLSSNSPGALVKNYLKAEPWY